MKLYLFIIPLLTICSLSIKTTSCNDKNQSDTKFDFKHSIDYVDSFFYSAASKSNKIMVYKELNQMTGINALIIWLQSDTLYAAKFLGSSNNYSMPQKVDTSNKKVKYVLSEYFNPSASLDSILPSKLESMHPVPVIVMSFANGIYRRMQFEFFDLHSRKQPPLAKVFLECHEIIFGRME